MLNRNDMNTSDESKEENSDVLVTVIPKQAASPFDKNLALLIAVSFSLSPSVKKKNSDALVKITKKSNKPILMYLLSDIWLTILLFLNLEFDFKFCRALSYRVNRPLGIFFQAHLRDVRLKQLLQHVVCGNQIAAEKIIKSNPQLLMMRGTVEDYSFGMDEDNHRKNRGTAYELALLRTEDEIMAEMIHSYLITFPEGRAEIAAQRWQAEDEMRTARDSAALHKIVNTIEVASEEDCDNASKVDNTIQKILYVYEMIGPETEDDTGKRDKLKKIILAIAKADSEKDFEKAFSELKNYLYENAIIESLTFNFAVLKAIFQFRNYLEPRCIISTGKQFNVGLLDEAIDLYDRKYELFGRWSAKNKLFWQKVIGYIQRFLPACYAQAFAQGLYYIVEKGVKLKRSLEIPNGENIFFFPLDSVSGFRLGFDFAAATAGYGCLREAPVYRQCDDNYFTKLCQAKTASLQRIMQQPDNHSESRCSIM